MSYEVRYNGTSYGSDYERAIMDATISGTKEMIHKKISSFSNEIKQSGGKVRVDIAGSEISNLKITISSEGIPEELKSRIIAAFNK